MDPPSASTTGPEPYPQLPPLKRPRTMSQSSYEHDGRSASITNGAQIIDGERPAAKKRYSQDVLDYPRRRATIACEICRSRKSRCDGGRPKCRLCTELNADCVYREPGVKLDAGDKLILEHLSRIEGMLQTSLGAHGGSATLPFSPAVSSSTNEEIQARRVSNGMPGTGIPPLNGLGTWSTSSSNISTMPKSHTTPALNLLEWPMIRDLVSRPYDPQALLQLEMAREPLDLRTQARLDFSNPAPYVRAFFDRVNVWYACVNPYTWDSYYNTAFSLNFQEGPESCTVLLVLALGHAAYTGQSISRLPPGSETPGKEYFAAAWGMLPSLMTRNNILSAQCHILASIYLCYLVRPLEAWNLLTNTSMKLQLLLSSSMRIPQDMKELSERVYWNTLLVESDLLAELDLPHSGIAQFEESVGLPRGFDYSRSEMVTEPIANDELWYFLAEIALRRLLNRVSHILYTKKASSKTRTVTCTPDPAVVAELDYQLSQWYENLPSPVKFPRGRLPTDSPVQTVLRLRYFACRTIIFRPHILAVLADESAARDPGVQDSCRKCLEACLRQVELVSEQ